MTAVWRYAAANSVRPDWGTERSMRRKISETPPRGNAARRGDRGGKGRRILA
ncbi:MAG: hypothetical protein AMXMBFR53_05400 [Gemmatimonadota bacterium]